MSKRIALSDYVEVDGVDISDFCNSVKENSANEQVDVSGFNATGADEFLSGKRTQSVDLGVFGSSEIHAALYHIFRDRTVVTFKWRKDQNNPTSATNPELNGNVQLNTWAPGADRGQADTFTTTLTAADQAGLVWSDT